MPLEKQEVVNKINTLAQYRMSDADIAMEDMKQGKMIETSGAGPSLRGQFAGT